MDRLKQMKRWVCWNYSHQKGHDSKVPRSVYGGETGSDEGHSATWSTYDEAVAGEIRGLAFGGSTWSMLGAMIVYFAIGAGMTAFFSMKIFAHPTQELMNLGKKVSQLI